VPNTPTGDTTGAEVMLVDRRPHRMIFRVLATIAIAFLIAWVGWTIREWMTVDSSPLPSPTTAPRSVHSIAVLPFESVGGGEENDAFTAGIHDDILNRIAKIGDLKVISRTSVMEYEGTAKNLKQIGRELDVGAVLEGAVRRAGDQVRINVQLLDVATEENLWAESYNREVSVENILGIQSDIAERVATALQATLSAEERQRITALPTTDVKAYELYLQGLEFLHRPGWMAKNLVTARKRFEGAVSRDPTFALAYAGLSRAARDHYWLGGGGPDDLDVAESAAGRALELQPALPEAHLALGTVLYVQRDYDRARAEMNLAREGLPSNSELVRWMGYLARRQGDWDSALENLKLARSLNPREVEATHEVGLTLLCMRRYDDAMPYFDQALGLAPDYPSARIYRALAPVLRDGTQESARTAGPDFDHVPPGPWKYAHGWQLLLYARDFEGAIEFVSSVERVSGQSYDYPTSLLVGWTRLLQDRSDDATVSFVEAARILEADVQADPDNARLHGALALTYAGLGRKEEALREGRCSVEMLPLEKDVFVGAWLLHDLAWVYTMTGESDAAVEAFDRILSVPSFWSIEALLIDPRIEPLRNHPGFLELVERHASGAIH
jgi:TolB-like protein/tetratricopeptide (TPR) repeat protein